MALFDTWPRLKVVYTLMFSCSFLSEWEHPHDETITRVYVPLRSLPDPLLLNPGHRIPFVRFTSACPRETIEIYRFG